MQKPSNEQLKEALLAILCVALIAFVLVAVGSYTAHKVANNQKYYTSEYSKYCYPRTIAQSRIKKRIYYSSLEECGKPLPQ